jgi:serine phosphatase RsbU (regulator of sigma subunit)
MIQQSGGRGRFCTIACAQLDLGRSPARVTVACGGHPLPVLVRADRSSVEVGEPGTLLGLVAQPELQDRSAELHAGDTLVLYTDGLTEAQAPKRIWSPDDLAEAARAASGGSVHATVDGLLGATIGSLPAVRDDVAVLALRASPNGAPSAP